MTRARATVLVLIIFVLLLGVLLLAGMPLMTSGQSPAAIKLMQDINESYLGKKLMDHYFGQVAYLSGLRVGPYKDVAPEQLDKIYMFLALSVFAALTALVGSAAAGILFVVNGIAEREPAFTRRQSLATLALVILAGTVIRLILAGVVYGNYDMTSYEIVTDIAGKGGNVYAETDRYNYSPVWFMVLLALKRIQLALPGVPFHFVVRSFLCGVDLLTLGVLLLIANIRKLPAVRTAIFFYLSPVSFLVTGYHGQFENFAMLMVLIGIFVYLALATRPVLRTALLWLFATAGMIVKHNVFYELIICLHSSIKRYWIKVPLFVVSVIIFLSLFIPYWDAGSKGIIDNAFRYEPELGPYGVTSLLQMPHLKYLFITAMFIFPLFLKSKDIMAQCLLGTLFFLTFATSVSVQYFALPVALGALRPSKPFLLYTLLASFLFLGSQYNVFIPGFHLFQWNVGWVGAVCWFIAEMRLDRQAARIEIPR